MREIRLSGLMRGGEDARETDNSGRFNSQSAPLCLLYGEGLPTVKALLFELDKLL
jgi:hypothetical protein